MHVLSSTYFRKIYVPISMFRFLSVLERVLTVDTMDHFEIFRHFGVQTSTISPSVGMMVLFRVCGSKFFIGGHD